MSRVIGLTGGIASGKSLVSQELRKLGMTVFDADEIGKEIMAIDGPAQHEVVKAFGEEILNDGGMIDRGKLGKIIFDNPDKRVVLEQILHPLILAEMCRRVHESSGDVVLDIALLIEKGLHEHEKMDAILVVYATREVQIQRLICREGISRQEAIRRIDTQLPMEQKVAYAHYLINNSGSVDETQDQVIRFYKAVIQGGITSRER